MTNEKKSCWTGAAIMFFPLAECSAFAGAAILARTHPFESVVLAMLASALLCFSVHITFHEAVHQRSFTRPLTENVMHALMSIVMGLPFDGYRWHHFNHHRFNNALEDYSSTWKASKDGVVPQTWARYIFGWPLQLQRARRRMDMEEARGELPAPLSRLMAREKRIVLLFIAILAFASWRAILLYAGMIYFGWVLVSLENYAQHPPLEYGVDISVSYYDAIYNFVFCKNGLHAEHHLAASTPWFRLKPQSSRCDSISLFNSAAFGNAENS